VARFAVTLASIYSFPLKIERKSHLTQSARVAKPKGEVGWLCHLRVKTSDTEVTEDERVAPADRSRRRVEAGGEEEEED
jgi:hypothetical protein